jgi:hypothetical protein
MREQFTQEEWQALCAAPWAVGRYMAAAVGGKLQEVRELLALGAALRRALVQDADDTLVGAVAAAILSDDRLIGGSNLHAADRTELLAAVAAAGTLVAASPHGPAYRRWLIELAHVVATAEADGGFLGFGGEAFHAAEQIALAELTEALGMWD